MSKIKMPDPVGWFVNVNRENGRPAQWEQIAHEHRDSDPDYLPMITTDQAEAYAAAMVREALEQAVKSLIAESDVAISNQAYAAVLALKEQADKIRALIPHNDSEQGE